MNENEAELIFRCQKGDQNALKEIFNQYHKKVYRIAYGVVRQREEALDIVQEVFIKLFNSIHQFRGKSKFYTYLYRMTMNTSIDHTRKMKKVSALSMDEDAGFQLSDDAERRPDRILDHKELEARVQWAMDQLSPDQKAALIFREVEGLSYQEIAEATGSSIGTVMSRLHYGRKRMQKLLQEYVKEGGKV